MRHVNVLLRRLIAKMSSTYERIEESALTEYIFPRARTILQMESLLMDWLPLSWTIEWRYGGPSDPDVVEGVLEEDVEDLLRLNQETKGSAANMDGWTSGATAASLATMLQQHARRSTRGEAAFVP